MAVKTSLQVRTTNPTTSETKLKTATFSNPDATNAQLNSFAQKMYGNSGLSANTVDSVIRVDKLNITNAQPEQNLSIKILPTAAMLNWKSYDFAIGCSQSAYERIDELKNDPTVTEWEVTDIAPGSEGNNIQWIITYTQDGVQKTTTSLEQKSIFLLRGKMTSSSKTRPQSLRVDFNNAGLTLEWICGQIKQGNYFNVVATAYNNYIAQSIEYPILAFTFNAADKSLIATATDSEDTSISLILDEGDLIYWYTNLGEELLPAYSDGIAPIGGIIDVAESSVTFESSKS